MSKQLSVRLFGQEVGILEQNEHGQMSFTYNAEANFAISLSLPVRKEAYSHRECEAYFDGLLPENPHARKQIANKYRINQHNSFSMLKAIGHDCAGAISCMDMHDPIINIDPIKINARILSEDELYQNILQLPQKPLFMGVDGLKLSLAGVHDKAAVCMIDGQIAIPENGCPSTHILKPPSSNYQGLVENEYFCMQTAAFIGLTIPKNEIRVVKDIPILLVQRYDRNISSTNEIQRIHQEDFCQALGLPSISKYQSDGGPGLKQIFNILNETTQPALDKNMLVSMVIYNFLIGNMDAHSKNFSLLHTRESQIILAPFYDLVCTRVYQGLDSKMAMKIGSRYDSNLVLPRHWEQFSEEINYSYVGLKKRILSIGESLLSSLDNNKQFFYETTQNPLIINQIIEKVRDKVAKTLSQF